MPPSWPRSRPRVLRVARLVYTPQIGKGMDGRSLSISILLMGTCALPTVPVHFISAQPAENGKQTVGGIPSGHDMTCKDRA